MMNPCQAKGTKHLRLPKPNTPAGEKWLNFLRFCNEDSNWQPKKDQRLCSKHFTTDSFVKNLNNQRTYLKEEAIPTIIGPVTYQKMTRKVKDTQEKSPLAADLLVPSATDTEGLNEIKQSPAAAEPLVPSPSSDTEDLDVMKQSPSSSDTWVPSPSYEMEVEDEFYEVPMVTLAPAVSSNKLRPCCDNNKELLIKIDKLERTVKRVQKVANKRNSTIRALRMQLKRLRKSKEAESENLLRFAQKERDDREYITVMNCLRINNPLLDHFVSSARGKMSEPSAALKKYVMMLHLVSPRAYNFVREECDLALPHPETVAKWCRRVYNPDVSDDECDPGFTKEEYDEIKDRVKQNDAKPVYLVFMD
ncbi:uncharacterized protein LOC134676406 isoform X2 [Cydia fagiglandana]|uniref:uncharacterized protein LOC134676406 isoform X2 n=1 Tax=Cydia fagiglandana TaxID=1458189 RepID=UPI002FEDEA76